jgi:hypothetical protein
MPRIAIRPNIGDSSRAALYGEVTAGIGRMKTIRQPLQPRVARAMPKEKERHLCTIRLAWSGQIQSAASISGTAFRRTRRTELP